MAVTSISRSSDDGQCPSEFNVVFALGQVFSSLQLGWLSIYKEGSRLGRLQQGTVVTAYLCVIMATFILQGLLCFQRDVVSWNYSFPTGISH